MALIAGFLLASGRHVDLGRLLATVVGVSLVIACGCVCNNYLDRGIDRKMQRTKSRGTATGQIDRNAAVAYAAALGILGFLTLFIFTNLTTVVIGIVGIVDYVILYGYSKRKSVYGTLVGTISGAVPPLAGFTAVSGHLNTGGILLFLILTFWQMPHFYAIAIFRMKDYANAKIPVLPIVQGVRTTKLHITVYIFWFIVASILLFLDGYLGVVYVVAMIALGLWWLYSALQGFRAGTDDSRWARKIFFQSLVVLTAFCVLVSLGALLP
jgi:protoheme IX farnesyltransferase